MMSWTRGHSRRLLAVSCSVMLTGCANLTSIERSTQLPSTNSQEAKAVHLDAKQRVVLAKAGFACAEPSPDALSAFASSISGSIALPNQASASLAQALQETSASIGLRTQSITLMRDTLYRICEAHHNNGLTQPQVMSLLARTQDLTLAVLAVEQLTGVVSAQQVALGGSANAAASAALSSNQQLLQTARDNEIAQKAKLQQAEQKLTDKRVQVVALDKRLDDIKKRIVAIDAALGATQAPSETDKQSLLVEKQALQGEQVTKGKERDTAAGEQKIIEEQVNGARDSARQATEVREAIEKNFAVALTQAQAAASGFGQFAGPNAPTLKLNDQSTQHIATAVENIVKAVINQSYVEDACFIVISSPEQAQKRDRARQKGLRAESLTPDEELAKKTEEYCVEVFKAALARRKKI